MTDHDPLEFGPLPTGLIADLQRICREDLGKDLTLAEAEILGLRMLRTFRLMYEVSARKRKLTPWEE